MNRTVIVRNIKRFMAAKNVTAVDLARMTFIPRRTIEGYLDRSIKIDSLKHLVKIAEALGISVASIMLEPGNTVKITEEEKAFLAAHKKMTREQRELLMAFLMGCRHANE